MGHTPGFDLVDKLALQNNQHASPQPLRPAPIHAARALPLGAPGAAVEMHAPRHCNRPASWLEQFGVNARTANAVKVEIKALRLRSSKRRRPEFDVRRGCLELGQRTFPVFVQVVRSFITSGVPTQLVEGKINKRAEA